RAINIAVQQLTITAQVAVLSRQKPGRMTLYLPETGYECCKNISFPSTQHTGQLVYPFSL
ncbi:MAG: hypothetical protein ACJ8BW_00185, partial [Ktedonobacteraceae bacterium]